MKSRDTGALRLPAANIWGLDHQAAKQALQSIVFTAVRQGTCHPMNLEKRRPWAGEACVDPAVSGARSASPTHGTLVPSDCLSQCQEKF